MNYEQNAREQAERLRAARGHATILAIESSCDETAAAIVRDGRQVISSVISSQIPLHAMYGRRCAGDRVPRPCGERRSGGG